MEVVKRNIIFISIHKSPLEKKQILMEKMGLLLEKITEKYQKHEMLIAGDYNYYDCCTLQEECKTLLLLFWNRKIFFCLGWCSTN